MKQKRKLLPNLYKEQKVMKLTNEEVAAYLGINRSTYYRLRQTDGFRTSQVRTLCSLFGKDFEYLFARGDGE